MNKTLFHPQMTGADAQRIARENGGRLVWRSNRVPLIKAKLHADDLERAVHQQIVEVHKCHQSA